MIDIETLSRRQNATIVSIGACSFTFERGIEHEFLVNVDPVSCKDIGLHIEKDTVDWWMKQPKEVRDMWKSNPKPVTDALNHLNDFIGKDKNQMLWSQGSVFDFGILSSAYVACDIKRNWNYWQENDLRTIFNLLGIRNDKLRDGQGGHHSALDDARGQTETLIETFKEFV
jgi:hypothetical protein